LHIGPFLAGAASNMLLFVAIPLLSVFSVCSSRRPRRRTGIPLGKK